jgi:hypothetical protein
MKQTTNSVQKRKYVPIFVIQNLFLALCNYFSQTKLTNSVAQEPEGSSPHSQTATGLCPEPVESNLHPQANLPL